MEVEMMKKGVNLTNMKRQNSILFISARELF